MEGTNLQTPDDALSYIAPIGEFVPYTCHVTASHPTIRTPCQIFATSLAAALLVRNRPNLTTVFVLPSCRLTSPHLSPTPNCEMPKLAQSTAIPRLAF